MSLSSKIIAQLSHQDIRKLGEWISKEKRSEILTSIKKSWKTRMYAIFLLRLRNLEGKQWRLFSYGGDDHTVTEIFDELEARALNMTPFIKDTIPSLEGNLWYLLGTISLRDGIESYNLMSWKGKWEGFLLEENQLLLCDKVADRQIERKNTEPNEESLQIERISLSSGKIEKIGRKLIDSEQKLHWRRLWVGKGVFNAGVKTVTFEGTENESLEDSARKLASKADGFVPGCEQDGSTIGWKIGKNSLKLRGELGNFKPELTGSDLKTLIMILNEISPP